MTPEYIIQAGIKSCKDPMAKCRLEDIRIYTCGYAEPGYSTLCPNYEAGVECDCSKCKKGQSNLIAVGNWNATSAWIQGKGYVGEKDYTPERVSKCLEKIGCELEWSDEWSACDDCSKLLRTQPNSHFWTPSYVEDLDKGTFLCKECAGIEEDSDED